MDACERCHGTGLLHRQDCGQQGITLPCPDCEIDRHDDYDDDARECFQCGGEGYVYGCSWDWQCDTWDGDSCLCTRRCDICNPVKLTPDQEQERDKLRRLLADALNNDAA